MCILLASKKNGVLYVVVTSNLIQRIWQHKNNQMSGFTKKYNAYILVYFEVHETMESTILKEKQIKKWKREWKISIIEKNNSKWLDLWEQLSL